MTYKWFKFFRKGIVFFVFCIISINLNSQIAFFNFQDNVTAVGVNPNISVSNVTISSGSINFQNGNDDGGSRIGNSGSWNQSNFSTTGKYLEFSITPNPGYQIDFSELRFRFGRTNAGPQNVTIQISTDNFLTPGTTILNNASVTSTNAGSLNSFSITSGLPSGMTGVLTIRIWGHNASGTGNLRFNNFRVFGNVNLAPVCADPTWHYRTIASGLWENGAIWQASPNGSTGWVAANCPPDATAQTITIRAGHEVNVTDNLTIDQTTIEENAVLNWTSGSLTIANGPGDDLTIFGRFRHNRSASAPYNAGATIRVKTDGVLEVNNNSPSATHYGTSSQIFYEDKAVFYWNVTTFATFGTSNVTFFPNAAANEIPIFRTNTPNITIGAGSVTRINGYFEVENNTVTWQNSGRKIFRNGLGGNGNITQASSSGRFEMDGDTAFIAGSGNINLHSGERLQTSGSVYVELLNNKTINGGQLRITNPSTIDAQEFELSGSANIQLNSDATLITKHPNGVDGSVGGLAAITYDTQHRQNIIFERNGPQNSGTSSLNAVLGSVTVRNGSQLTLQQDLSIENSSSGGFLIEDAGSELGALTNVLLNINGNRFFTLQNGGTMNDNCLENLNFETGGNSSTAIFSGNGETIKCHNFYSEKTTSGGLILTPNSTLVCGNNLRFHFENAAVFNDGGNLIEYGDDLRVEGNPNSYTLTGTIRLNAISGTNDIEAYDDIPLNNFEVISGAGATTNLPDFKLIIEGDLLLDGEMNFEGSNAALDLGGNVTLQNTVTYGGQWRPNVQFIGNNAQVISTGANTFEAFNFYAENKTGGSLSLATGDANILAENNLRLDFPAGISFSDGDNTIVFSDDLEIKGDPASYNFTGTLRLIGQSSGNHDFDHVDAQLNNLEIILNDGGSGRARMNRGTADNIVVKGNFIYDVAASYDPMPMGLTTLTIGGDFTDNSSSDKINEQNSTWVFNGAAVQSFSTPNFQHTLNNLVIDKPSNHLNLNGSLNVDNNLNLTSGNINTSSSDLIVIRNNATVSNASDISHVNGPCRKVGNQSFTFPIGKNGLLRPASISNPANSTHHFTAEYFQADPDPLFSRSSLAAALDHVSACEYWTIDRTNGSSAVDVTLTWDDATSCGVTMLSDLRVARWNGSQWADEGNGGTSGNLNSGAILTASTVTNFSPFTLASSSAENPLPIELVDFSAAVVRNETAVLLEWQTASEINNHYFTLERSLDGFNWTEIHEEFGAGNSNSLLRYEYLDEEPVSGISYYRLKQTDFDGQFEYFPIRSVQINHGEVTLLYRVNTLGQKVGENYQGIVILYFSDGSSRKVLQ